MSDEKYNYKYKYAGKTNDAIYGLGLIGALFYYLSTASSFWIGVLGVIKAILWPAFLVYAAMNKLGA